MVEKKDSVNQKHTDKMANEEFDTILKKYKKTDGQYYNLLLRIMLFCTGNFHALLEKAEQTNKKLYLIKDTLQKWKKRDLCPKALFY